MSELKLLEKEKACFIRYCTPPLPPPHPSPSLEAFRQSWAACVGRLPTLARARGVASAQMLQLGEHFRDTELGSSGGEGRPGCLDLYRLPHDLMYSFQVTGINLEYMNHWSKEIYFLTTW